MASKAREEILSRLKQSCPVMPPIKPNSSIPIRPGEVQTFIEAARQGAATVYNAETAEVEEILFSYLESRGIDSFIAAEDARLPSQLFQNLGLRLGARCIEAADLDEKTLKERAFDCNAGITCCDAGIAQTGSLVIFHRGNAHRLPSIAPPIHVGIVWRADILNSLDDIASFIEQQKDHLPGAITVISGVSRTADINLNITLGMHGPLELVIIVIGGDSE